MENRESKRIEEYFTQAKQLPVAMSLAEVSSLISAKGVTSPPNKSWWNLNNIIMTTLTIIAGSALLWFSTHSNSAIKAYNPIRQGLELSDFQNVDDNNELVLSEKEIIDSENEAVLPLEKPITIATQEGKKQTDQDSPESPKQIAALGIEIEKIEKLEDQIEFSETEEIIDVLEQAEQEDRNWQEVEEQMEPLGTVEGGTKTVTKTISVEGVSTFLLNNRNGDINIGTWEKQEIEVTATFTLEANDKADEEKGLADFDLHLKAEGENAVVSTNWDDLNCCSCTSTTATIKKGIKNLFSKNSSNQATADDGEKFSYEKFKIEYDVKIPTNFNVDLSNQYANITMTDLNGDADLNLFQGDLAAANINGNVTLKQRYGKFTMGNSQQASVSFFHADGEMGNVKNLSYKASYSNVKIGKASTVEGSSFQSDFTAQGVVEQFEMNFRYGDLNFEETVNQLEVDAFQSKIKAEQVNVLEIKSSYSDFTAKLVKQATVESAFQSEIKIDDVGSLSGDFRYTPIAIQQLNGSMEADCFQGKISIDKVNANFKALDLKTKYTDVNLTFSPEAKYELDAITSFSTFSAPASIQRMTNETGGNNNKRYAGIFNQGSSKQASKVSVNSFQGDWNIQ